MDSRSETDSELRNACEISLDSWLIEVSENTFESEGMVRVRSLTELSDDELDTVGRKTASVEVD